VNDGIAFCVWVLSCAIPSSGLNIEINREFRNGSKGHTQNSKQGRWQTKYGSIYTNIVYSVICVRKIVRDRIHIHVYV